MTPAAWVERARVETARRLLETGGRPKQAAGESGVASRRTPRRHAHPFAVLLNGQQASESADAAIGAYRTGFAVPR